MLQMEVTSMTRQGEKGDDQTVKEWMRTTFPGHSASSQRQPCTSKKNNKLYQGKKEKIIIWNIIFPTFSSLHI